MKVFSDQTFGMFIDWLRWCVQIDGRFLYGYANFSMFHAKIRSIPKIYKIPIDGETNFDRKEFNKR